MNKIRTYDDLLEQEQKMKLLLQAQKELVLEDIRDFKEELKPVKAAANFFSSIISRDKNNFFVNSGVNQVIDLIFKKIILARAGWLTRRIIPFFLKNYSSHFIARHKEQFIEKLFSWIGNKNGHEKATAENQKDGKEFEPF